MIRCTPTMGFKYSNQGRDSTVIVTLLHREGLYEGSLLDLAKDIITGGEYYGFYDLDAVVWEISIANSFHGYDDRVVELFEQMGVDVGDDKHLNQWLVVRCSDWAS